LQAYVIRHQLGESGGVLRIEPGEDRLGVVERAVVHCEKCWRRFGDSSSPDPDDLVVNGDAGAGGCRGSRGLIAWARAIPWRPDPAELDQFEAERFDLRQDPEQRGAILEHSGQDGLAAVNVMDHRGKRGECGDAEASIDPDAVEVGPRVHATIVHRRR
jgi:hypothetical protein